MSASEANFNCTIGRLNIGFRDLDLKDIVKYSKKIDWCGRTFVAIQLFLSGKGIITAGGVKKLLKDHAQKEQILTIYPNLATVYSIKEIANKNFAPIVKVKEEPKPIKSALKKQKKNDSFQGKRIKFDLPSPENSMNLQESSQKNPIAMTPLTFLDKAYLNTSKKDDPEQKSSFVSTTSKNEEGIQENQLMKQKQETDSIAQSEKEEASPSLAKQDTFKNPSEKLYEEETEVSAKENHESLEIKSSLDPNLHSEPPIEQMDPDHKKKIDKSEKENEFLHREELLESDQEDNWFTNIEFKLFNEEQSDSDPNESLSTPSETIVAPCQNSLLQENQSKKLLCKIEWSATGLRSSLPGLDYTQEPDKGICQFRVIFEGYILPFSIRQGFGNYEIYDIDGIHEVRRVGEEEKTGI